MNNDFKRIKQLGEAATRRGIVSSSVNLLYRAPLAGYKSVKRYKKSVGGHKKFLRITVDVLQRNNTVECLTVDFSDFLIIIKIFNNYSSSPMGLESIGHEAEGRMGY